MTFKVLLFDDIPAHRAEVRLAIEQSLGERGTVQEFAPRVGNKLDGTYEDRLALDLTNDPNANPALIVADRDLSSFSDSYPGLSEATVRRVANVIGIPECGYARGERGDDTDYIQQAEQREACIRLSLKPLNQFASQVVGIVDGFSEIEAKLSEAIRRHKKNSPGSLLANILGQPQYTDKISLYATGDQNRIDTLVRVGQSRDAAEKTRRLVCLLGYWLWDSVLRFPGVLLNEIATSSYLNIRESEFKSNQQIQNIFAGTRYHGPFANAKEPLWWRGGLDDLIAESGAPDGRSFASTQLGRAIATSQCYIDPSVNAGFYCMLAHKPVSLGNSKGGLPWFPRGADIARVSTAKLDELGPWL